MSIRLRRVVWVWLLVPWAGAVGCFGGQTGTELAPDAVDDTSISENGGKGTPPETDGSKGSGTDVKNPASLAIACDDSEPALNEFASATGLSAAAVSEFLALANPFTLTSSDGTNHSATLGWSIQAGLCVVSDAQGKTLRLPMSLLISSADGGVQVALAAIATAIPKPDGGVARLEIEGSAECDTTSCATLWVDSTGYSSMRPTLSARLQAFGAGVQVLGQLTVWGRPTAECAAIDCSSSPWRPVVEMFLSRLE